MMENFNCVLLVDDDGVTNFINHRLIKKLTITTSIQSEVNGADALRFIRDFSSRNENKSPELILLDINMPVVDGFEFLEEFEKMTFQNKEKIRILVLTTSTHKKDVVRISNNASLGYVNKPLTIEKLTEALNQFESTPGMSTK